MPRPLGGVVYFRGTPSVCPYALKLNENNFAFLSSKFKRTLRRTRSERLALFFHRTDFTSFRSGSVLRLRSAKTRNSAQDIFILVYDSLNTQSLRKGFFRTLNFSSPIFSSAMILLDIGPSLKERENHMFEFSYNKKRYPPSL